MKENLDGIRPGEYSAGLTASQPLKLIRDLEGEEIFMAQTGQYGPRAIAGTRAPRTPVREGPRDGGPCVFVMTSACPASPSESVRALALASLGHVAFTVDARESVVSGQTAREDDDVRMMTASRPKWAADRPGTTWHAERRAASVIGTCRAATRDRRVDTNTILAKVRACSGRHAGDGEGLRAVGWMRLRTESTSCRTDPEGGTGQALSDVRKCAVDEAHAGLDPGQIHETREVIRARSEPPC